MCLVLKELGRRIYAATGKHSGQSLASGKVPVSVSKFLARGSLIALNMNKPNCLPDIRRIAMGEPLCCLVGKCLCEVKASEYFAPLQMEVAVCQRR